VIVLSDKVAKTSGQKKILHAGRLKAAEAEIACLLREGDDHLTRLREAWHKKGKTG
jgi:hypothetical protein